MTELGNTIARIDPASNLVIATTRVGNGPASVATSAAAVWVAERLDDAVGRINPETNSVTTTIPVGRSPTGIAVGFGSVWVANSLDGTVSRIDPARNRVTATIPVGGSPTAISVGNGRVWVSVRTALVAASGKRGDVVRVASTPIDYVDPAIADSLGSWQLEYVTCAGLLNYPDRPAPEGSRLVPEVAAAMPTRSADGKSYTFTVRQGFRFSPPSNAPVTAQAFKYAIERALSPKVEDGPGRNFVGDIVGARAYETGKAKHISGISVRGNTLTVRLTDIAPDILARLSLIYFCPVPLGTPVDPGGRNTVPSAGPYYVASYVPDQGAVLKRNPNYHGSRPRMFDEIDVSVDISGARKVKEVEAGTLDYASLYDLPAGQRASVAASYGPRSADRPSGRSAVLRPLAAGRAEPLHEHQPTVVR